MNKRVQARNEAMDSLACKLVFNQSNGVEEFGYLAAQHVLPVELEDSNDNMDLGLRKYIDSKNDVAVFAWFERFFGRAITEYVDAIDDGADFLRGVYRAFGEGVVGRLANSATETSTEPPEDQIERQA